MISAKGLYEWSLIDANTKEIISEGKKWNLITDGLIRNICLNYSYCDYTYAILLSSTVLNPSMDNYDYREYGSSHTMLSIAATGSFQNLKNSSLNYKWTDNNFSPPVSPRTISVIGIAVSDTIYPNAFQSFIELDTPITQQTNQYLYVKYTVFLSYVGGGLNSPNNHFLQYVINKYILSTTWASLGLFADTGADRSGAYTGFRRAITVFNDPPTPNNVMRNVDYVYKSTYTEVKTDIGSMMARRIEKSFSVSEFYGPIGCICQSELPSNRFGITPSYSPIIGQTPSISRVFTHPASRISQIFSDPSYPPSSNGSISLTGTPDSLAFIIGRIKIEKTGDASDIIDEAVLAADVNTGNNQLTVSQVWGTNDIIRIDNDLNDPPSPLSEGVDYYVIYVDNTHIKLSTSYNGTEITLLDQGAGSNTISRQNTGKYSIELEPYTPNTGYSSIGTDLQQLPMGIDFDGKAQPVGFGGSGADYGEGGVGYDGSCLVRGIFHDSDRGNENNYVYSIQKSNVSGMLTICRWKFWTIETSMPLCVFGSSSTIFRAAVKVGTLVYIATASGIYLYDITTPTVSPSLISITGIINTNIFDLAYDSDTGYMWSGHSTGLSKINLSLLTATQYITGTGNQLQGMAAIDVCINQGQLTASGGKVIRAGIAPYSNSLGGYPTRPWVMEDGVGWVYLNNLPTRFGTLRKGKGQAVVLSASSGSVTTLYLYGFAITGKGTGTVTTVESFVVNIGNHNPILDMGRMNHQISQVSDSTFLFTAEYYNNSSMNDLVCTYSIGSTPLTNYTAVDITVGSTDDERMWKASTDKNLIDFSNGMVSPISWYLKISKINNGVPFRYGWSGDAWEKDNLTTRNIPKTGTSPLLNGLSVAFNNAVGKAWDQQFVIGERFTFIYGPGKIKDNLQTLDVRCRGYYSNAEVKTASITIPASPAYTYHVPEVANLGIPALSNVRDVDSYSLVTVVNEGSTAYSPYSIGSGWSFSVSPTTNILTVGTNISTGTPVYIVCSVSASPPFPLKYNGVYYAINVNSTTIKLATTYANAMAGTEIDILTAGSSQLLYIITPATGQYFLGSNGIFVFSSADAGKAIDLEYTVTYYG